MKIFKCVLGVVVAVLMWQTEILANAQSTGQGTISGTVTDISSAVLPNAHVSVTNIATNVSHDRLTNATGYFEVNNLNPGIYNILVSATGFKDTLRAQITLETNARVNVPIVMQVGGNVQAVVVTADASLLDTENGQVLTTKQLEFLPVTGNNPTWLELVAPGTQATLGQSASQDETLDWTDISSYYGNFGILGKNDYSIDGAPNVKSGWASAINLTADETAETNFNTTAYDASIGHTIGVEVTQTTKAGTNKLHGSASEAYTPRRWGAMNHFERLNYYYQRKIAGCDNGTASASTCLKVENDYGFPGTHSNNADFTLGGPVYIPKIINGHDKLFFFVSVLDDVFSSSTGSTAYVPTVQERSGDFSDLPTAASQGITSAPAAFTAACPNYTFYGQYQIYDPHTVTMDSNNIPRRTPFCGNIVPTNRVSDNTLLTVYNSFLPTPTQNSPTGSNYLYTNVGADTYRDYTFRIDYKFTAKDDVFVRYTRGNYTDAGNSWTKGNVGRFEGPRWIDVPAIGWNHTFNNRTSLDITAGGSNFKTWCCYYPGYDKYKPSDIGLPSYTDDYASTANKKLEELPIISVGSYSTIGATDNVPPIYRSFALRGNLTHVYNNHTFRMGAEYRLQNASQPTSGNVSGTYAFDDSYTQENDGADATYTESSIGLSYAALMLGVHTSASVAKTSAWSLQSPYYAIYFGDNWRVTRKLTLSPGLRFEHENGVVEKHNRMIVGWNDNDRLTSVASQAAIDYASVYSAASSLQKEYLPTTLDVHGGPVYAGVNGAPKNEWDNNYRFLPRLAASYLINSKFAVRAGYGLYFDTMNSHNSSINQDGYSASTGTSSSTTYGQNFVSGTPTLTDPFPANSSGVRFNSPVGNSLGDLYYFGSGDTYYDHSMVPPRQHRGSVGVQYQINGSTLLDVSYNIGWTSKIAILKTLMHKPSSIMSSSTTQPYVVPRAANNSTVANPFPLSSYSGYATSNPNLYTKMSLNSFFTSSTRTLSTLIQGYQQMSSLYAYRPLGKTHFQELLVTLTHRYSNGLSLSTSVELNDQHDRDYFANSWDNLPTWEQSNNSRPIRFTVEGVYDLPLGKGRQFVQSGWLSQVLGGFNISGAYEAQPGALVTFANGFYIGTPKASDIKYKHPIYVNNQASGGSNYVQWLKPGTVTATYTTTTNSDGSQSRTCTYTGTGFSHNSNCQPSYNYRVFPTHIDGVRQMGQSNVDANVSKTIKFADRLSFETRVSIYNVFNHCVLSSPDSGYTSSTYGEVTSDGFPGSMGRWLSVSGRLRF